MLQVGTFKDRLYSEPEDREFINKFIARMDYIFNCEDDDPSIMLFEISFAYATRDIQHFNESVTDRSPKTLAQYLTYDVFLKNFIDDQTMQLSPRNIRVAKSLLERTQHDMKPYLDDWVERKKGYEAAARLYKAIYGEEI